MKTDWTHGFSLEDIAHRARFLGCGDYEAARHLQAEYEQDERERILDEGYHAELNAADEA